MARPSIAGIADGRLPRGAVLLAVVALMALGALLVPEAVTAKLSSMTTLDSPIRDTQWVGPSDEVVFTVTESGHVWASKDGGVTWNDHSAQGKIPGSTDIPAAKGAYEPPTGVQAFYFHPTTPNKMFFRGGGDTHWITTNSGDSYERVDGPAGHMGVATVRLHPVESDWFLVMVRRWSCWSKEDEMRARCADDLFLTKDFGRTWTNITEKAQSRILGFVDFDWAWTKTAGENKHHHSFNKDTILATVFEARPDVQAHLRVNGVALATGWDPYVDLVHSNDYFATKHTRTVPCGNQFEIMNDKLFLAVAEGCSSSPRRPSESVRSGVRLQISSDYGATFALACFPRPLVQRGYSVVHATNHTAFVNVDYAEGSRVAPYGDLLVADGSLALFGLALRRNARSVTGAVDFAAIQGMPGVYVANQLSEYTETPMMSHGAGSTEEDDMTFARSTTVITFNSGATWQPLQPPTYSADRRPIRCESRDGCSLHLHGTTSWVGGSGFAFVYSHASTPGLVISTGNVGAFLYQDSAINTYLSRDAGQTWEEVAKGSHIYEFGDSGGVIVMTKHGLHAASSSLSYSLDEGLSWTEESFAEEGSPVDIFNIRVEPDNQGKKFLVQGLTADDGSGQPRKGVLISLDFSTLPEFKLCQSTDYELWTPNDAHCFLGQNISLQRQTRASKCWNGESYTRPAKQTTSCACSAEDYQCDFGTEPDPVEPTTCRHLAAFSVDTCPSLAAKSFRPNPEVKRLMAGDACTGHWSGSGAGKSSSSYSGSSAGSSSSSSWGGFGGGSSSSHHESPSSPSSSSSSWFHRGGSSSSISHAHAGSSGSSSWMHAGGGESHIHPGASSSSSSSSSSSHHGWSILGSFFFLVVLAGLSGVGLVMLASRGLLPDTVLRYVPFLENVRYQNLRSNFQSLAHDFGLGGGDDDYEEMYRRP